MTAVTYEMMLACIAAVGKEGATREALLAGPSPYTAAERLQQAIREGQCFVARQCNGLRLYFKSQADLDAFSRVRFLKSGPTAKAAEVMRQRVLAGGKEGITRAEMTQGLTQRQTEQGIKQMLRHGWLHVYGSGNLRRYFGKLEWWEAYRAARIEVKREHWRRNSKRYHLMKPKAEKKPKPVKAPKVPKASKPKPVKTKAPKPITLKPSGFGPPKRAAKVLDTRPVIVPSGLKVQRLPGFTGERWGAVATGAISSADCRPWAMAATA